MTRLFHDKSLATKFQILIEIAEGQPYIQQKSIARSIDISPQAVSQYVKEMKDDGWIDVDGRSNCCITKEGVDWTFNHDGLLKFYKSLGLHKEDILIQCGDYFDRTIHRGATNQAALKTVNYLANMCSQVILLQGNHDISKYAGSNLDSIDIFETVHVIKDIQCLWLPTVEKSILFLPYIEGLTLNGKYEEKVNEVCQKKDKVDWIIGHHMFQENAIMDSPYLDLTLLNVKFSRCIQGHVHKFETFKRSTRPDDICVGSICPANKGEKEFKFVYLTADDKDITFNVISPEFFSQFINVRYTNGSIEKIDKQEKDFLLVRAKCKREEKYLYETDIRKNFPSNIYEIEWELEEEEKEDTVVVKTDEELITKFFEENKYSKEVRELCQEYMNR